AHEGRARSLRNQIMSRQRADRSTPVGVQASACSAFEVPDPPNKLKLELQPELPAAFSPDVDAGQIITVVSGLPRSGASMMMQLLVAAGREALTDASRIADEDNPLGYLEFEKTLALGKDASWLPEARGKVLKVVAQLLPSLASNERYNVIFMERNPAEVLASQ